MSDAEYMVNDLERTIEELRRLLDFARGCWYESVVERDKAREEADRARIDAERWKMLYEQARDE